MLRLPRRTAAPTSHPSPTPWRRRAAPVTGSLLSGLVALAIITPAPAAAATTWSRNLFVGDAFLYQDPYGNACVAAATMFMLNTIAYQGTGGPCFAWSPYRVQDEPNPAEIRDMTSILAFARSYDTLNRSGSGSDPHGWRNALNWYGWGSTAMTDAARMPYQDREYRSLKSAVKAAVKAIARRGMPVGMLGWAGRHAQVITGYVVTGADPRTSSDFTVTHVYLSDPLRADATVNRKVSYRTLNEGSKRLRFRAYRETDSPKDDRYVSGFIASAIHPDRGPSEWYGRWVLLLPVRNGLAGS